jgi:anti-sigma-K factor RskA
MPDPKIDALVKAGERLAAVADEATFFGRTKTDSDAAAAHEAWRSALADLREEQIDEEMRAQRYAQQTSHEAWLAKELEALADLHAEEQPGPVQPSEPSRVFFPICSPGRCRCEEG